MNFSWPAETTNAYFPWYMILWHGLWYVPYLVARSLFVLIVLIYNLDLGLGLRAWDETR